MADGAFTPVTTGRISAEIVDQIKSAIREGRLAPGDQLPPERELTRQLGVSRVSVRDALRMLEASGLVEVRVGARGGAFVTAPAPGLVGEGLADMLFLSEANAADVTEARSIFEVGMLEFACARRTDEDLAALEDTCDRAETLLAAGTWEPELSVEFHTRLARCAHNPAVTLFADVFHGPLLRSLQQAQQVDPRMGATGALEHRALVDALRARDGKAARRIMRAHLVRTAERVAP